MRSIHIIFLLLGFQLCSPAAAETSPYDLYRGGFLTKAAEAYVAEADSTFGARPLMNAAMCMRQAGDYREAINLLQRASYRDPGNADIYSELGWLKFHSADYEGARNNFETAIAIDNKHARAELGLASVYSNLKDKEKMLVHLEKYRKLRPDFAGVDYILAWNYMSAANRSTPEPLVPVLRITASSSVSVSLSGP